MNKILWCAFSVTANFVLAGATFAQAVPDFTGVWRLQDGFKAELKTIDGKMPPLLPEAAEIYREHEASHRIGDLSFDAASTICLSPGMPRMLLLPYPFQIMQRPHQMAFLFEWNNRHRLVDLSGKELEIDDLSYMGTASGSFEGQTLVIETRGIVGASFLDASGMPHSDRLHLIERYRLKDGGGTLSNEITVEDPQTFSYPWTTVVTYKRMPDSYEIQEDVCRERIKKGASAFELEKYK